VLFAWIYDTDFRYFRYAQFLFGYPWVGLYFNSRFFRLPGTRIPYDGGFACPERFVSLPSCKGIAVADPWIVESMEALAGPGKRVVVFPDFTDTSHDPDSGLALKIRALAGKRPIVSLVGHLQRTKGLVAFTAALQRPELSEAFFFLGGEVYWGEIDSSNRELLLKTWEDAPNLYCHLQYLSSESCLNAVINVSDVIFAAYSDFPNTSNIMTKAALLRKPVLVSEGHLMADLTRQYHLGEVLPEGDVDAIAGALQKMISDPYLAHAEENGRWLDFSQKYSADRLKLALQELLSDD
jgi:glycosyltransferase involved in cell wall biosynthesis